MKMKMKMEMRMRRLKQEKCGEEFISSEYI